MLKELENEIFKEIINIGLAKAADSFALISKEKVLISAPDFKVLESEKLFNEVTQYSQFTKIVDSDITGELGGKTFLLFSDEQANRLSEICLGNLLEDKVDNEQLKASLLLEVGNIITGSLVTQLSNILKIKLFGSIPTMQSGNFHLILKELNIGSPVYKPLFFTVKTEFLYSWKSFEFPFLLIFNVEAYSAILTIIKNLYNKEEFPGIATI